MPLGVRAFALLVALLEANGSVVSKEKLIATVWRDTVVEENNLQVNILALRRALGPHRHMIRTVSGRGYMLAALDSSSSSNSEHLANDPVHKIPKVDRLFGREKDLERISEILSLAQIVTLAGPGGVGKTSLAVEFCHERRAQYKAGARFVSLALIDDEQGAREAIAKVFDDLPDSSAVSFEQVVERLAETDTLLVLDNCEQILDIVARISTTLVQNCPHVRLLITSRSALGIDGEMVYQVPALEIVDQDASYDELLRSQSTQLFLHRAQRASGKYPEDRRSVLAIGEICRKLDGIPLAIELAAARSAVFGLETVASRLDDRLDLLSNVSRDALPRHQTLRAVFDWSFALLSQVEKQLFMHCGAFAGGISLDAASYVMKKLGYAREATVEALSGLVSKSLLVTMHQPGQRFNFLESTRAYAIEQLEQSGTAMSARRAQADYCLRFFEQVREATTASSDLRLSMVSAELENVRTALNWCFNKGSAEYLGVELICEAAPLLFELSLLEECSRWGRVAIERINQTSLQAYLPRTKLKLLSAYASSLIYSHGPCPEVEEAFDEARCIAEMYQAVDSERQAVWGLWNNQQYQGECLSALAIARRFSELAVREGNKLHVAFARRMLGISLHYVGAHEPACENLEAALSSGVFESERWVTTGGRVEQTAVTRATLARALWLGGNKELGMQTATQAEALAREHGHEMTLAYVLVEATIPLALLSKDVERALDAVHELRMQSRRAGLNVWLNCCDALECAAESQTRASDATFLTRFSSTVERMAESSYGAAYPLILLIYARAHLTAGNAGKATEILEKTATYCKRRGSRWLVEEFAATQAELDERALLH
ncbi:winged helix-turn-helix domain-containing protein [Paraburkholderia strydomiana]|uniref:ATP-binding protein n=1 Tax=Paraburkholderia strydomiana TaxID=1245417 RepID=UPI0038B72C5E